MINLAQYFTQEPFSNLLTSNIVVDNPKVILDLGIGNGSLTSAAQKKWKDAQFFGIDVDQEKVSQLNQKLENVTLYNLNSLDSDLYSKINIKVGTVDIAICNPPYLNIERSETLSHLLASAGLPASVAIKNYTTDLLFFAQNLALLKTGGVLGIILPAGMLCGHEFLKFRRDLLENHTVEKVIELQSNIFKKTEAKTFILIVKKGKPKQNAVLLSMADADGQIENSMVVDSAELYWRMDYSYHSEKSKFLTKGICIGDIATTIKRGVYTNLELKATKLPFFHTTDFKNHMRICKFADNNYDSLLREPTIAKKGDILVGRVGKSCHEQILFLKHGRIAITDCVYRIELPKEYQKQVFTYLYSKTGRQNLKMIKHGVCAQVISKIDLERIWIDFNAH